MSEPLRASIPRPPVYRITLAQLIALAAVLLLVWLTVPVHAKAVLAGGMIEVSARAYFGFYAFRHTGARQMHAVVRSFRRGEMGKFVLVALLFGVVFATGREFHPLAVFSGYLLAWLVGTISSMRLLR